MPQPGSRPVPSPPKRAPLRGSDKAPLPGAARVGEVPDDENLSVTVLVRRRPAAPGAGETGQADGTDRAGDSATPLSREEFAATLGADPEDLERIVTFARQDGITVTSSDAARRTVGLAGTAARFGTAFGVRLGRYAHDGGTYRGREGALVVPTALAGLVEGVFGLDDRPAAQPYGDPADPALASAARPAAGGGTVAIIELGVGDRPDELAAYLDRLGVTPTSPLSDEPVSARAGRPSGSDAVGNVPPDVRVVGAAGPDGTVAVYFAPNTDRGFVDAVTAAIHDRRHPPAAVSIGWGAPRAAWTAQSMAALDAAFADAAALGVPVLVPAAEPDVDRLGDFPASSPHVTHLGSGGSVTGSAAGSSAVSGASAGRLTGGNLGVR